MGLPARQVHLHLLRQGQDEEEGCWHLVLPRQELPRNSCGRRLELLHHRRRLRPVRRQEAEGVEGSLNVICPSRLTFSSLEFRLQFCINISECLPFRKKKKKKKKKKYSALIPLFPC